MRIIAIVAITAWVTSVHAQSVPLEIKGVPFGATPAELMVKIPGTKCSGNECLFSGSYAERISFGPATTRWIMFYLSDGKLANAQVGISAIDHFPVVIALTEKYGKPTSEKSVPVQNRMGAKFDNHVATWNLPDGVIEAKERNGTVDSGWVIMSTTQYLKDKEKELIDKSKAAASKL